MPCTSDSSKEVFFPAFCSSVTWLVAIGAMHGLHVCVCVCL